MTRATHTNRSTAPLVIRPVVDGRPPASAWPTVLASSPAVDQPPLDLTVDPLDLLPSRPPDGGTRRAVLVRSRWTARPRRNLPDAVGWSASLGRAIGEVLLEQRPLAQLQRWLSDDVLGLLALRRATRSAPGRVSVPVVVQSVRVQHPHPESAEVCVLLGIGSRPLFLALRLEAQGDRWLGTALELGPMT